VAQRAIKFERRSCIGCGEALREDDLEDVAGADVLLGPFDHLEEVGFGGVGNDILFDG
jgi:hypothetical protein